MAQLRDYTLTFDGTVQQLSDALTDALRADRLDVNVSCDRIDVQADHGNADAFVIGGSTALTAASYGVRIPPAAGGIADPPYPLQGPRKLSDVYVLGTAGEAVHVLLYVQ